MPRLKQGDVVAAARWQPGVLWTWWHEPADMKGLTPWGWVTQVQGGFFTQAYRPVGDGTILVVGIDTAETSTPEDYSGEWLKP